MIVSFGGSLLRSMALEHAAAAKQLGDAAAAWLHALLAEIEAAETAKELASLFGDSVSVEEDYLRIVFGPGLVALFRVIPDNGIYDVSGKLVWREVRRLKLVEIDADKRSG